MMLGTQVLVVAIVMAFSTSESLPTVAWRDSYGQAMAEAKTAGKMMLVYFHDGKRAEADDPLVKKMANEPELRAAAERFVLVRIPVSARAQVKGQKIQLIRHNAFSELQARAGLAIIDLADPDGEHYGTVVSIYPLDLPGALRADYLDALLSLPTGSLTQRSLILAVRMHPEKPASSDGVFLTSLASESESHSAHQAAITYQGHHQWESRFHRISGRLPSGYSAQEVCAESWPGKCLMTAAIDCVDSWRQSPGHWSAVHNRHAYFGYDMKRGRNGIWYATGIFSVRR